MKILVFGNSDSTGRFVAGETWTEMAQAALAKKRGTAVEVTTLPFSAEAPSAAAYVEKKTVGLCPDVVVLPVGSFAFTAGFGWVRVRALFGERAGQRYRQVEERFDARTRQGGRLRRTANIVARRVTRAVVGTKPLATREQVTQSYVEVLRTLARHENLPVIILTYPGRGAHARTKKAVAMRRQFFADVKAVADACRYQWVNGEELFASIAGAVHTSDNLHMNEAGHARLAQVMVDAVMAQAVAP
jgi:hypothetical protein